jgi:hypothetical protein
MTATNPSSLPFTGDPEADTLLATDPMAMLIGFVLDQQVSVQKAFSGPLELKRRIGTLDAAVIAGMDAGDLSNRPDKAAYFRVFRPVFAHFAAARRLTRTPRKWT